MARVKLRLGDAGGAESALKRAIDVDRTCEDAYVLLVNLYRERGQDAQGARDLARAGAARADVGAGAPRAGPRGGGAQRLEDGRGRAEQGARARRQPRRGARGAGRAVSGARAASATRWRRWPRPTIARATARPPSGWCGCRWRPAAPTRRSGARRAARGRRRRARSQAVDRLALARRARSRSARAPSAEAALKVSDSPAAHLLLGRALEALGPAGRGDGAARARCRRARRSTWRRSRSSGACCAIAGAIARRRRRIGQRASSSVAGGEHGRRDRCAAGRAGAGARARRRSRPQAVQLLEQALARRPQSLELAFALGVGLSAQRTVGARGRRGARDDPQARRRQRAGAQLHRLRAGVRAGSGSTRRAGCSSTRWRSSR